MPTLLNDQGVPHAYHPYNPTNSHSSKGRLNSRTDSIPHMLTCRVAEKIHNTSVNTALGGTVSSLSQFEKPLVKMGEAADSSSHVESLTTPLNKLQSSHASLSVPSSISTGLVSGFPRATQSGSESHDLADSPIHFPNSQSTFTTQDSRSTCQTRSHLNQPSPLPNLLQKSSRCSSSSPVLAIVHYLKTWRAPAEYYARRRYQHPSLLYPSRRPSLPSLLEERIANDGNLVTVCPELAMSTSLRAYQRKIFPAHVPHSFPVRQLAPQQGWDEDSDEDIDNDFSEDDDSIASADDFDEAVTPVHSPPFNPTHFLQPLILTKLPGY